MKKNLEKLGTLFFVGVIVLYQRCISPFIPARCRFLPTCSAYGIEALKTHGVRKGLWLTLKRLGKCHPIPWLGSDSGFDPVPQNESKKVVSLTKVDKDK